MVGGAVGDDIVHVVQVFALAIEKRFRRLSRGA
jgi:hypothetical protein